MDIDITPAVEKAEKMINDLTTKKINYDREYTIEEMMEFENGTVFADIKYPDSTVTIKYDIENGCKILINNDTNTPCKITDIWLNTKFKLIKKDKKVSFEEAIQAYGKVSFEEAIQAYGKEIYCIWEDGRKEHKSEYCIRNEWDQCITDQNCEHLTPVEIVKGEWYIKED